MIDNISDNLKIVRRIVNNANVKSCTVGVKN